MRHECTLFVYVGELCRYLLATPPNPADTSHKLRGCFGNGLRPDIFDAFRERFKLPRILEFYGATEGNISLFNFDSMSGAVGRIPKFLERKFSVKIVRFDIEREEPIRGPDGLCIECAPDEVGEILGEILDDPKKPANKFDGYADKAATDKKILRDVFRQRRCLVPIRRSHEEGRARLFLFRRSHRRHVPLEGRKRLDHGSRRMHHDVSGRDGSDCLWRADSGQRRSRRHGGDRAGEPRGFDLAGLREHLKAHLPDYARPMFLRLQDHLEITGTFKPRKLDLVNEGFDPARTRDPIYVDDKAAQAYLRMDGARYEGLVGGIKQRAERVG